MRTKGGAPSGWFWSLALVALGIALLLNNFLLISGFNVTTLLPLVLVIIGAVIVVRGDIFAGGAGKNFSITRGSVESAALEISAGAIDVQAYALQREGRLIAGQFAPNTRPFLTVDGVDAKLRMDRAMTTFFSFSAWTAALANDLPWKLYVSTHLGQVSLDLSDVIIDTAVISTGLGNIQLTTPKEALAALYVRSALGVIRVVVPAGQNVRIIAPNTRLFTVQADKERYANPEAGIYVTLNGTLDAPETLIYVNGTFGDAYFA